MLQKFQQFISNEKLFAPHDKILLAVSGGMDSCAMAWLFHKSGFRFGIAHCNFGLRGMESDGDEYFVKELAAKLEVPFYCRHFNTKAIAKGKGLSIQMAARELRYEFFYEIAGHYDFNFMATAHHRDDEAETFFINLFRSTGIAGLHGISVKQEKIIRPMLFTTRDEIEKLVKKEKIRYREDSSNSEDKYLRNKIRHSLIPAIKLIAPDFSNTLKGNLNRIRQAESIYRKVIQEKAAEIIISKNDRIIIPFSKLKDLEPLPSFLYEFLVPYGFNEDMVSGIMKAMGNTPGKAFYSNTHRVLIDRKEIIITAYSAKEIESKQEFLIDKSTAGIKFPVKLKFRHIKNRKNFLIPDDATMACLDEDKLLFPLIIRRWKKGDYFFPLGMRGKKKLSDFFTDNKLSLADKENLWLLCSGKNIIWVTGLRIDNRFKITSATKNIFIAEISGK
jgi:tRNA(Ile)-lysidine synthase